MMNNNSSVRSSSNAATAASTTTTNVTKMATPRPKLDLFNESPFLVSKKCRTSTPSLRPPKPPMKSSKLMRNRNNSVNLTYSSYSYSSASSSDNNNLTLPNYLNNFHQSPPQQQATDVHEGSFLFPSNNNNNNNNFGDEANGVSCRLTQQFEIICKIGSGYFANVYKCKSLKDGQYYAIKKTSIPFKSNSDRLRKLQEVRNHQSVPPHPNCVKYYDFWEEDGYLYIQTELCRISLNEILETSEEHKLPEHLVWSYLIDLLLAVKHLHDNQLLHLDIKPDNILISFEGVAKLADFGLMSSCSDLNSSSHEHHHNQHNNSSLTVTTTAADTNNQIRTRLATIPDNDISILEEDEDVCAGGDRDDNDITFDDTFNGPLDHDDSGIINRTDESIDSLDEGDSKYLASETMQGKFTKAADIFCLGITMFEVASGLDLPQRGEVYHKLRHNEIEDLYFNGLSADLVKVIKMMMEEDYTKRPSVDELLQMEAVQSRRVSQARSPSTSSSLMSSSSSS